jgi:predicted nucleic acid-binding protein
MSTPDAVIIDANVLVSICSKEQGTYPIAFSAFDSYAHAGWEFFAPNVIVAEVMFALCVKFKSGALTQIEYDQSIGSFADLMQVVSAPDNESALIKRAVEIRGSYVCKRTSDSLYIAFAEELARSRVVEILTFDNGIRNQISNHAPAVKLNLLAV